MASSPRQSTPNMDKLIQEALHRRAALERQHSIHTATSASPSNGRRNENENATPGQPDNHSAALYLPDGSLMEEVVRPQKRSRPSNAVKHRHRRNRRASDSKAHEERGGMRRKKSRRQLGGVNAPPTRSLQ
uniref:Uncharacterized protein n=1 Tax=Ditylenchus dipsaci TaxID=166011 RepID=A0A915D9G9_9BILA